MPKVTFLPVNVTVEAKMGESILDVALNHDIPLEHACGGFCACTTCHIKVKAGASSLSALEEEEIERLGGVAEYSSSESRLGCQARVKGDVTVEMVNYF